MMSADSNDRVDGSSPTSKLALDLSQRTVAFKIRQKLHAVIEIHPNAQLLRVVPKNSVTTQPEPPYKSIVRLDEFFVT